MEEALVWIWIWILAWYLCFVFNILVFLDFYFFYFLLFLVFGQFSLSPDDHFTMWGELI